MDHFANIVHRIASAGKYIAGGLLIAVVALTVVSVITRRFGWAFPGSYELTELLMLVTIGFALGYAALTKAHIAVDLIFSRFPHRIQMIIESLTSIMGIAIVAGLVWAGARLLQERWFVERTDSLGIPFAPLRIIWLFALLLFCLLLLIDLVEVWGRKGRK